MNQGCYKVCVYGGELDGPRYFDTSSEARDYAAEAMCAGAERFKTWHIGGEGRRDRKSVYDHCDRDEFAARFNAGRRDRLSVLAAV